jgi:hypothetical protein
MNARLFLRVLLTHKQIVIAGIAALRLIMFVIPLDELSEAFAAPRGGAKPAKPANPDSDGNYGHTVKPAKPAKPANPNS